MSMDFTEFKRRLGAEPRSRDPALLAARDSSAEHREAVIRAETLEEKLELAASLPVPPDLLENIHSIAGPQQVKRRSWWPVAMAASILMAIGAAGIGWNMSSRGWESVEAYVMDHYRHDGDKVLALARQGDDADVHAMLARFDLDAMPELADIVSLIKYCPTPEGKGIHMILDTRDGPVTVIYMPDIHVKDQEMLAFDAMEALLVDLEHGSAVIIGANSQHIRNYYTVVHDSIVPIPGRS
ncbi:MAG: DUF3379 family protein [Xanthomonadales bacterium]|nr:DUF3379 family protein [Xanthomonadales bacterium]